MAQEQLREDRADNANDRVGYATPVQHLIISARLTAFAASRANYIGRKYDDMTDGALRGQEKEA